MWIWIRDMWKNALYPQLYLQKWMGVELFVDMATVGLQGSGDF